MDVFDGTGPADLPSTAQDLRCAALFVVAAARGIRAAALLADPGRTPLVGGEISGELVGEMAVAAYRALASIEEEGESSQP
ncbi:MAG: hypothetical protein WKF73_07895 [Nocardioidaceae bacterium]